MKKRKNYNRWIHYSSFKNRPEQPTTLCGKKVVRIEDTTDKDKVTCRRCLELMEEKYGK